MKQYPIKIFLKLIFLLFIKIYRKIGNIISAELYLAKNANIAKGNDNIKKS